MSLKHGLASQYALEALQQTIYHEIEEHAAKRKRPLLECLKTIFARNSDFVLISWVSVVALLLDILLVACFTFLTDQQLNKRFSAILLELLLLVVLTVILILLCIRENHLRETEVERLIRDFASKLQDIDVDSWKTNDLYPDLTVPETDSLSLVWTYRDDRIVNLPWNLLVEGDVVVIGPSRKAPANCRQLFYDKSSTPVLLETGEVFIPNSKIETENKEDEENFKTRFCPRQLFEVIEAPIKEIISCYYTNGSRKQPSKISQTAWQVINITEKFIIWPALILAFVVNLIRWQVLGSSTNQAYELLLLLPCHVILPLMPLVYPMIWIYVGYYGSARLQTLYHSSTKVAVASNESEDVELQHLNCRSVFKCCMNIITRGSPIFLPRTVNLVHTVGSITTFSCVDKEGILCYPQQIPEKIFFFKEKSKVKRSHEIQDLHVLIDDDNLQEIEHLKSVMIESEDHKEPCELVNDIEIMSISSDPKTCYGMQFDDIDWKDQLPSLRPLSSNIILNAPCSYPMKSIKEDDFLRHLSLSGNSTVVGNTRKCMCSLADYIGYPDRIQEFYKNKHKKLSFKQIDVSEENGPKNFFLTIVKDKHVPYMTSSVVSDGRTDLCQLFTQGSGDLILEACTDIWNGEEICRLKDAERKKALNFFQRMNITRNCIAFAYRPIFQDAPSTEDEIFEFIKLENEMEDEKYDEGFSFPVCSLERNRSIKRIGKDLQCEDLLIRSKPIQPPSDGKDMRKQVFLGMLTMVHTLKEDLIHMIDILHFAGIRFVHFSYENELLSRVFCQRLGLETGWNCHISLGDGTCTTIMDESSSSVVSEICPLLSKDDETMETTQRFSRRTDVEGSTSLGKHTDFVDEDDYQSSQQGEDYFEPYFMSNRSKLPKGIHNMRSHLSDIDDVPLLVPLFTECSAPAVTEMTCIRQEYGDIVCCIGSSLNARNYTIFTQSDVSIALEPISFQLCSAQRCTDKANISNELDTSRQSELMMENGPLALSAMINSITCSLTSRRKDNFPFSNLICEARRLYIGFQNLFLFLFSSQISITLLLLLASIFLLPPPLSGLNILWLLCVILPLLSVSLVGTSADKSLMKLMTGKRRQGKQKIYKELVKPFLHQFSLTFGLNALFVTTVMFPWLLYNFCTKIHGRSQCHWFFGNRPITLQQNGTYVQHDQWYGIETGAFYLAQDVILFLLTLFFAVLSTSFINRTAVLWRKYPSVNKPWCLTMAVIVLLQFLYNFVSYHYWHDERTMISLTDIPFPFYLVAFAWLVLGLMISELVKRRSIREFKRLQKRERLKFDTKLGMNSPV